jgi:hypothetical protein
MKLRVFIVLTLSALCALIAIVWLSRGNNAPESAPQSVEPSDRLAEHSSIPTSIEIGNDQTVFDAPTKDQMVYLPSYDYQRVKQLVERITSAAESSDPGALIRAFHMATYSRSLKNVEIQEAFRHFLQNDDHYVRFLAAKYLYITGDDSGKYIFLDTIQMPEPFNVDGVDQRIRAAQILAKYRDVSTIQVISGLYARTKDGSLLGDLALLSARLPGAENFSYIGRESALTEYGLVYAKNFIPNIKETFNSSTDSKIRLGAARSLAQMTGGAEYINYLVETTREAISNQSSARDTLTAVEYMGSINAPEIREVLLLGLQSNEPSIVRSSAVNLLYNQNGGYEPVRKLLLAELKLSNVKDFKLGESLKWNLVTQMSEDAQIERAAKNYSERTHLFDWEYYVVERRDWPIYNWIDNYVVNLNSSPKSSFP